MRRARLPIVYVFVRRPVLGAVKSRLAAGIGAVAAHRFYRQATIGLLRRISSDRRWRTVLAVTPDPAVHERSEWPFALPRVGQGTGDLGQRMARVLAIEPGVPALIIGSDIPDLSASHIAAGFDALGAGHLVFGPALDGGYWLIGRRAGALPRGLFDGVRWSSSATLADTKGNVPPELKVTLLECLEDVDDEAAFVRWCARRYRPPSVR